jgi:hypothetical protein
MKRVAVGMALLLLASGCGGKAIVLTEAERQLAQQVGMPEDLLGAMKRVGNDPRRLEGTDDQGVLKLANGITVSVLAVEAADAVKTLRAAAPAGWLAFVSAHNFDIGGEPDHVSLLKGNRFQDAIQAMGTNGINYDIGPEKVSQQLAAWDARYGLVLEGAGFGWFEASFTRPPADMVAFAREVYAFCPDVVDQGTGAVEALAAEMSRTNTLYLWWD